MRAHVCISSRPYAWRPKSDRQLIEQYLPFAKRRTERAGEDPEPVEPAERAEDALEIYFLQPLEEDDIRLFASHRSAPAVDHLIRELARSNFMALAARPFDLEEILDKWAADLALGGRSELLRHNIERRLGEIDPDRDIRQPLNLRKAREGARTLAAAVVLTGEAGIRVPDSVPQRTCIDAKAVLPDWRPDEVQTLLERALFDDVIYGAVRFRNRDVRELLAAEWFDDLLQKSHSRHPVETLFFREQYGEQIVSPRLRVVLPWLILDDESIRTRALAILPEIAVEGGDPARLPLPQRRKIVADLRPVQSGGTNAGSAWLHRSRPPHRGRERRSPACHVCCRPTRNSPTPALYRATRVPCLAGIRLAARTSNPRRRETRFSARRRGNAGPRRCNHAQQPRRPLLA